MGEMTADVAKTAGCRQDDDRKVLGTASDCGFGKIGISAVAAAARYQGSAKNPAYAPASSDWRDRIAKEAA